mmetsp:Transcript_102278/g.203035  ORF Transcript_102278/g.203035 Transcript_102278/m.203035 type:complete len:202 (-) Transcript_102278:32-637(-)
MPWGNYIKKPCEQCGSPHWAFAGTSNSGTRTLCRPCARAPSLTGPSVATAAAANVAAGISTNHQTVQMRQSQSFQRLPAARQGHAWRAPAWAQREEMREIHRDMEAIRQLEEVHRYWQTRTSGRGGQVRLQRTIRPDALLPAPASNGWKSEDCVICLDILTDSMTVCALPRCGHVFHRTCIESWLTRGKPECPLDAIEVDL